MQPREHDDNLALACKLLLHFQQFAPTQTPPPSSLSPPVSPRDCLETTLPPISSVLSNVGSKHPVAATLPSIWASSAASPPASPPPTPAPAPVAVRIPAASRSKQRRECPGRTCANCGTDKTSLWRRSETGQHICNACGLYRKLKKADRPVQLRTGVIKHRRRLHASASYAMTRCPTPAVLQWHSGFAGDAAQTSVRV